MNIAIHNNGYFLFGLTTDFFRPFTDDLTNEKQNQKGIWFSQQYTPCDKIKPYKPCHNTCKCWQCQLHSQLKFGHK